VRTVRAAPATVRGRATLDRILDAAALLFYEQGVRATGLEQIIAASSTGKGQLYHYFDGKGDLVLAVIERQIDRVLAAQQPLLRELTSAAAIDAWLDLLVQLHANGDHPVRCPLGALAAELAENDPAAREALSAGLRRWSGQIADGLRIIQSRGGLDPGADCDALADATLAAYQGGVLLAQAHGTLQPLRAALAGARAALHAHGLGA
jgi:AcrR family transcriptional regulator